MRVNHPANTQSSSQGPSQTGGQSSVNDSSGSKQSNRTSGAHEVKRSDRGASGESEKMTHTSANTEISAKSKEFAQAKAVASDAPDVREDRVADLKRKIAEGSYVVDNEALADRLVDDHLRMPGMGSSG